MTEKKVPENARGIPASSPFWEMTFVDQNRFRAGWWANYHRRKPPPSPMHAWQVGWDEAELMLRGSRYRFALTRDLGGDGGTVLFCMLNPSTADDTTDDPTIRRCMGFARLWGFSRLRVVNLFAVRSTDPKGLRTIEDPVGRGNDDLISSEIADADLLVAAWGAVGGFMKRKREFLERFGEHNWMCLGHTKAGHPKHPLYVSYETELVPLKSGAYL